ncbi:MAG: isocitrate/isopropylmalate family dehydrogenase, partial [Syntrophales bacterium]|nr:isocitrate/isopropylmalate family dehydrogenase [Syntrophales bacterium]
MNDTSIPITIFPGDGVGGEVIAQAVKVLKAVSCRKGVTFSLQEGLIGGAAYDALGTPFPAASLEMALTSRAVLLGAVGGPPWEPLPYHLRPERALLGLREKLGLYANIRPVRVWKQLIDASPLKRDVVTGTDILIIRELTGDLYFGEPRGVRVEEGRRVGINTMRYTEDEIARIARVAFAAARGRRKLVTSVDKANVVETTELWREVVIEV